MIHTKASVTELMTAYEKSVAQAMESDQLEVANVVAKLTVTFNDLTTWVVEIHTDATYHDFYCMYHLAFNADLNLQKTPFTLPTKNRNFNTRWSQNFEPGLTFVLTEIKRTHPDEVARGDISIYNKTAYEHLLTCAPDELGKGLENIDRPLAADHQRFLWLYSQTDAERKEINVRGEQSDAYRRLQERRSKRMGWGKK